MPAPIPIPTKPMLYARQLTEVRRQAVQAHTEVSNLLSDLARICQRADAPDRIVGWLARHDYDVALLTAVGRYHLAATTMRVHHAMLKAFYTNVEIVIGGLSELVLGSYACRNRFAQPQAYVDKINAEIENHIFRWSLLSLTAESEKSVLQ